MLAILSSLLVWISFFFFLPFTLWFPLYSWDSKVHGTNMRPVWGRQDPGGPHVHPMNSAIRVDLWDAWNWCRHSNLLPASLYAYCPWDYSCDQRGCAIYIYVVLISTCLLFHFSNSSMQVPWWHIKFELSNSMSSVMTFFPTKHQHMSVSSFLPIDLSTYLPINNNLSNCIHRGEVYSDNCFGLMGDYPSR